MKLPRFLTTRLASALVLGCALLAFSPLAKAYKTIPLTEDQLGKFSAAIAEMAKDPAVKAEFVKMFSDTKVFETAMTECTNIPDATLAQYPKVVAACKSADTTATEFFTVLGVLDKASGPPESLQYAADPAAAKANQEFYRAHEDQAKEIEKARQALFR